MYEPVHCTSNANIDPTITPCLQFQNNIPKIKFLSLSPENYINGFKYNIVLNSGRFKHVFKILKACCAK